MKKLVASCALALALTGSVNAALGGDRLIDLLYMPQAGNFAITPEFTYSSSSYETRNTTGSTTPITETDNSQMDIDLNLEFGLLDGLSLGANIGYRVSDETETKVTATSQKTKIKEPGLKDVNLFGRFRLFHQGEMGLDLDLRVDISPGLANNKIGTASKDGNAFRGGMKFGASTDARIRFESMSLVAGVAVDMTGSRTDEDATTGVEIYEWESQTDITINGDIQFGIGESLAMDLGADIALVGSSTRKTKATGAKVEYGSHTDITFGGNLRVLLDESMAFGAGVDYTIGGDYNQKTKTSEVKLTENTDLTFGAFFSLQL